MSTYFCSEKSIRKSPKKLDGVTHKNKFLTQVTQNCPKTSNCPISKQAKS